LSFLVRKKTTFVLGCVIFEGGAFCGVAAHILAFIEGFIGLGTFLDSIQDFVESWPLNKATIPVFDVFEIFKNFIDLNIVV
jgi:hypothetical protein